MWRLRTLKQISRAAATINFIVNCTRSNEYCVCIAGICEINACPLLTVFEHCNFLHSCCVHQVTYSSTPNKGIYAGTLFTGV
jgi:hypothetical protein